MNLSTKFWAEAVSTSVYLKKNTPTAALNGKIPEKEFYGTEISLAYLKVFGCLPYVHVPKEKKSKWESLSKPCTFVGYTAYNKQYIFYDESAKKTYCKLYSTL